MAPKKSLNLARASDGEEARHHRLRHCRELRHKSHKHRRDGCVTIEKKKKKKSRVSEIRKLELEEEEANKSLYLCYLEHHDGNWVAYVVRAIKLSDLLSSSDDRKQLRQVAYKAGDDLPGSVGCGVWGSQILFAGGLKPSMPYGLGVFRSESLDWHRHVYAFETDPNKQPQPYEENNTRVIRKMDATLQQAKFYPFTVELAGKLYALSCRLVSDPPSFEVFDPKVGSWAPLPQPPFFIAPYHYNGSFSYAIGGTKMFVSHERCPVYCFDVAHPDREWRLVPTMCRGGPFPFVRKALVLPLPPDDKKKIMFAYSHERWCLGVYLMSLYENQESITLIADLKLAMLPDELGYAQCCDFVHIGGQKACLVVPLLEIPYEQEPEYEPGTHKTRGVAIPFQFQVDITKVDKDQKNCFTLQFMPTRIFEFHTNPSTYPNPETVGCFVL